MKMKAYIATEIQYDDGSATIVFAETPGRAKVIAMHSDAFEDDCRFTDIRIRRLPEADKLYKKGKYELDFSDPNDRYIMVKRFGFYCFEPSKDCTTCKAKKYCSTYCSAHTDD